jgi:hypothetical protein
MQLRKQHDNAITVSNELQRDINLLKKAQVPDCPPRRPELPISSAGAGMCGEMIIAQLKGELAEARRARTELLNEKSIGQCQLDKTKRDNVRLTDDMKTLQGLLERLKAHTDSCPVLNQRGGSGSGAGGVLTPVNRILEGGDAEGGLNQSVAETPGCRQQ